MQSVEERGGGGRERWRGDERGREEGGRKWKERGEGEGKKKVMKVTKGRLESREVFSTCTLYMYTCMVAQLVDICTVCRRSRV